MLNKYSIQYTYSLILKSRNPIPVIHVLSLLSIAGAACCCVCVCVCVHCPHNVQPISNLISVSFDIAADNTPTK